THGERHTVLLAGALALSLVLGASAPARAQLAVAPEAVTASVAQGETATRTVTLMNTGSAALSFCLSFERPLQRTGGSVRISDSALGAACGPYGEVLALVDREAVPATF